MTCCWWVLLSTLFFSVFVQNAGGAGQSLRLSDLRVIAISLNIPALGPYFFDCFLGIVHTLPNDLTKASFGKLVIDHDTQSVAEQLLKNTNRIHEVVVFFQSALCVDVASALPLDKWLPPENDKRWTKGMTVMLFKIFPHGRIMKHLYTLYPEKDALIWTTVSNVIRRGSFGTLERFLEFFEGPARAIIRFWFSPSLLNQFKTFLDFSECMSKSGDLVSRLYKFTAEVDHEVGLHGGISLLFGSLSKNTDRFLNLVQIAAANALKFYQAVRTIFLPCPDRDYTDSITVLYSKVLELCFPENTPKRIDINCRVLITYLGPTGGLSREQVRRATVNLVAQSKLGHWSPERFLALIEAKMPVFSEIFVAIMSSSEKEPIVNKLLESHRKELSDMLSTNTVDKDDWFEDLVNSNAPPNSSKEIFAYLIKSDVSRLGNFQEALDEWTKYTPELVKSFLSAGYKKDDTLVIEYLQSKMKRPSTNDSLLLEVISSLDNLKKFEEEILCNYLTSLSSFSLPQKLLAHLALGNCPANFEKVKDILVCKALHTVSSNSLALIFVFSQKIDETQYESLCDKVFEQKIFTGLTIDFILVRLRDKLLKNSALRRFIGLILPRPSFRVVNDLDCVGMSCIECFINDTDVDIVQRRRVFLTFFEYLVSWYEKMENPPPLILDKIKSMLSGVPAIVDKPELLENSLTVFLQHFKPQDKTEFDGLFRDIAAFYGPEGLAKPKIIHSLCKIAHEHGFTDGMEYKVYCEESAGKQ